jgi:hypothetical protein
MKADCAVVRNCCFEGGNEYSTLRYLRRPDAAGIRGIERLALRFKENSNDHIFCLQTALLRAQSKLEEFMLEVDHEEDFLDVDRQEFLFILLGDCPNLRSLYLDYKLLNVQAGSVGGPGFQRLQALTLSCCNIEAFPFDALPELGELTLELVSWERNPVCVKAPQVRSLCLSDMGNIDELEVPRVERLTLQAIDSFSCVGGLSHLRLLSIHNCQNINLGPNLPEVLQEAEIGCTRIPVIAQVLSGFRRVEQLNWIAQSERIDIDELSTALNNVVQMYVREPRLLSVGGGTVIDVDPNPAFESLRVLQLDLRDKGSAHADVHVDVARGFLLRARNLRRVLVLVDRSRLRSIVGWENIKFSRVPVIPFDPICGW